METDMRDNIDWTEAEDALRDVHAQRAEIFRWWEDEEEFVTAQMQLIQSAYWGGYGDALDDVKESADKLDRSLDETLKYLPKDAR